MTYFQYLCTALSAVLIFLLTKIIIERNEQAISMVKILGYSTGEISGLYLIPTTWAVILSEIVGAFVGKALVAALWAIMLYDMDGWFVFIMEPSGVIRMIVMVFFAYLVVMLFDMRRIRRVRMDEALKNAE